MEAHDAGTHEGTIMTDERGNPEKRDASLKHLAGQYLTFKLGQEVYGLGILKVQEIIGMLGVTRVPQTPAYVRGVINLRGKVIPVMELRLRFEMEAAEDTERTCVIVVRVNQNDMPMTMGLIVDEVSEVTSIGLEQIEPAPSLGASVDTNFILGMGKVADKVIMLLDVDRIVADSSIARAANTAVDTSLAEEA